MKQAVQQKAVPQQKQTQIEKHKPVKQEIEAVPEYLRDLNAQEGFEEVRQSDVKIPRLALAQDKTTQLEETEPNHIEGLKKGHFFNTVTGENYGESVKIIPLLKFGNRLLFRPLDQGGGILCRSDDMKTGVGDPGGDCRTCPLAQFGSARDGKGKGTACNEFFNFPVLIVGDNGRVKPESIAVASMKSTHIDAAKTIIGFARARQAPMYAGAYKLTSKLKKFGTLSSFVPVVDNAGWVLAQDKDSVKKSYELMHSLRQQGRLVADEPTAEEVYEPGSSDESNS